MKNELNGMRYVERNDTNIIILISAIDIALTIGYIHIVKQGKKAHFTQSESNPKRLGIILTKRHVMVSNCPHHERFHRFIAMMKIITWPAKSRNLLMTDAC